MNFRRTLLAAATALAASTPMTQVQAATPSAEAIVSHYADIALATYSDSLNGAKTLQQAIEKLLAQPTGDNLSAARNAWIQAREPYQQSEAFRFGNPIIDEWEGKVNAWPLDEGLIDYVDNNSYGSESDVNPYYAANIIANPKLSIGGVEIDASEITPQLLSDTLQEIDGVESNVATGYHAIEFLLWGQDLNGTRPGAGSRPATDFDPANCTGGHCERRAQYLRAATELLISDLQEMVDHWKADGAARAALLAKPASAGLATITTGMGSLAYGELGGERTKLGLMLHDPEEEHDCFSDNTHWSHYYDAKGIKNVYLGAYTGSDGKEFNGDSLSDLVASVDAGLDRRMKEHLAATEAAAQAMVDSAANGAPFDVMIAPGNSEGGQLVQNFVDALVAQTRVTEEVIAALNLGEVEIEGSDSLDNPAAVLAQ